MSELAELDRFDMRPSLSACEEVIERAFTAYASAGLALKTIRENRLYRSEFSRFDDYCRSRWGWSRVHAHRLIEAAEIHELLYQSLLPIGNKGTPLPRAESIARALKPVAESPEVLADTWVQVVNTAGEEPTAAQVTRVVAEVLGSPKDSSTLAPATQAISRLMARGYSLLELRQALESIEREQSNE